MRVEGLTLTMSDRIWVKQHARERYTENIFWVHIYLTLIVALIF